MDNAETASKARERSADEASPDRGDAELGTFVCELLAIQSELRAFVGHLIPFSDFRDDIVQEVNLLVMEKRRHFEPGTNFRAWVFTFARNVTMKWQKRARERREFAFDPDVIEVLAGEFSDHKPDADERLDALRRCLLKVPTEDRGLLLSRYRKHGNLEVAAGRMGVSSASVRGMLFRLRIALRRCIEREMKPLPGAGA